MRKRRQEPNEIKFLVMRLIQIIIPAQSLVGNDFISAVWDLCSRILGFHAGPELRRTALMKLGAGVWFCAADPIPGRLHSDPNSKTKTSRRMYYR